MKKQQVKQKTNIKNTTTTNNKNKLNQNIQLKIKPEEISPLKINKQNRWFAYGIIAIFSFILYGNSIPHSFTLDDTIVIVGNDFTRQGIKGIPDIFKYDTFAGKFGKSVNFVAGGRYRPLSVATFAIEAQFFGKDTTETIVNRDPMTGKETKIEQVRKNHNYPISHAINVLLYAIIGIFIFIVLGKLFKNYSFSPIKNEKWNFLLSLPFLATMFFVAHPIHTEGIANIKGRDELMTFLGSLIALYYCIKYYENKNVSNLYIAGFSFFLALLSKENAITFVAIIPIAMALFTKAKTKDIVVSMVPILLVTFVFLMIRKSVLGPTSTPDTTSITELLNNPFVDMNSGEKYATIFYTFFVYLKLQVFPYILTYDYYPYHIPKMNWGDILPILSLLIHIGMIYFGIKYFRKYKIISFSIWFYLIPLSIVANLFFPVGCFMNERFIFISSLGFCIFLAFLLLKYLPKYLFKENIYKNTIILFSIVIVILSLYSFRTITRNTVWESDYKLFTTDVKTSEKSAKTNATVGDIYRKKFDKTLDTTKYKQPVEKYLDSSIYFFEKSLSIHPKYVDVLSDLGYLYNRKGQIQFNELNRKYSKNAVKNIINQEIINNNLKSVHKYFKQAIAYYKRCIILVPNTTKAIDAYPNIAYIINNFYPNVDEKIAELEEMLTTNYNAYDLNYALGNIYGKYKNDAADAAKYLERAAQINPNKAEVHRDLGIIYGMMKLYDKSISSFLEASRLDPKDMSIYQNLIVSYESMGNMQAANEIRAKLR